MQKIKSIHCARGVWKLFTMPLSCEGVDPETKRPVAFFKSKIWGQLLIFTDKTRSTTLVRAKWKRGKFGYATWEVFDAEKNDKPLGTMAWAIFRTALAFGAEKWEVTKPDGSPFLTLEIMNSSVAKRILDDMTQFYNPTHEYSIKNEKGKIIANFMAKRGFWGGTYSDLRIEDGVTEEETKMTLALFAGLILLYKK